MTHPAAGPRLTDRDFFGSAVDTTRPGLTEIPNAVARGDFATAERLFLAFEQRYPASGHVEDTTFLRALTRLRRGDEAGGKALSREYLKRYPNGFRAPEAVRIAKD